MVDLATNKRLLLTLWRLRCLRATQLQYRCAQRYQTLDALFTLLNVASSITVLVLSSAYWMIEANSKSLNISIGLSSILVVTTSTMQLILDYRTRWKTHERAAAVYAGLNRDLEELSIKDPSDNELAIIKESLTVLRQWAPSVPRSVFEHHSFENLAAQIGEIELKMGLDDRS